jgi:hypothetical protein
MSFTEEDRAILHLAAERWSQAGGKVQAMHDRFGLSDTRFAARVNRLLDDPEAERAEPTIVRRLARLREARRRQRAPRTNGSSLVR